MFVEPVCILTVDAGFYIPVAIEVIEMPEFNDLDGSVNTSGNIVYHRVR